MRRKKWTEAEEETLISSYSEMLSSGGGISQLRTREKKFQPIADRVNSLYHLRDPTAFPFRWSWRDVSIKIQNMRHQYLGVKVKLSSSSSTNESTDWDHALHLWPNFLRYKDVFGDIDPSRFASSPPATDYLSAASEDGNAEDLSERVVEFGEVLLEREENRRDRECSDREGQRRRQGEMQVLLAVATLSEEEDRRERWRRWEERREEEDMEWRERVLGMQMDHERLVMQMHADSCQTQMQMLGILARLFSQFMSPTAGPGAGGSDSGINGLHNLMMQNLQQQQQQQQHSPSSMVGDNGKNDGHSAEDYL